MATKTANPLDTFTGGITGLFVGPPGTGKSHLLGSIGELTEDVLLIAPKPREINSFNYRKFGFDKTAKVFDERGWRPSLDKFESTSFVDFLRFVEGLYEDEEYGVVLVDPFTDLVSFAAHDLMKGEHAATPRDMSDSRGFYGALKYKLAEVTDSIVGLASPTLARPKHVLVAVHAQPAKEDEKIESMGIEFEGKVLPMVEGSFRQKVGGEFDIVGYTRVKHGNDTVRENGRTVMKKTTNYIVQLVADNERHAKVSFAYGLDGKEFPNHFPTILEAVLEARGVT